MSAFVAYLISGVAIGCTYALVASGFVVIHRVTRVVNFAQGTFAVVGGMTTARLLSDHLPHGPAEIVAIAVTGVLGLIVGAIAIGKPGTPPLASLIITLGLAIAAYAGEIVVFGFNPVSFQMAPGAVQILGTRVQWQYFLVIGVTLLTFAGLGLLFTRTYLGKALTACSSNPYAARLAGISVVRMGLLSFALSGMLGGLAGMLITPIAPVSFDSDALLAVNGFAAAIFGGLMSPALALTGGLVLGVSEAMIAGYYNAAYQTEVALALMLALMVWQARNRSVALEEAS